MTMVRGIKCNCVSCIKSSKIWIVKSAYQKHLETNKLKVSKLSSDEAKEWNSRNVCPCCNKNWLYKAHLEIHMISNKSKKRMQKILYPEATFETITSATNTEAFHELDDIHEI